MRILSAVNVVNLFGENVAKHNKKTSFRIPVTALHCYYLVLYFGAISMRQKKLFLDFIVFGKSRFPPRMFITLTIGPILVCTLLKN